MIDITVIGGIAVDIEGLPYSTLRKGESNPGRISISYGGVGRNITENLARIGAKVAFVSAVGNDFVGKNAVRELKSLGVNVDNVHMLESENTAIYLSILNHVGDMEMALCNMDVLEKIAVDIVEEAMPVIKSAKILGIDANLTHDVQQYILDMVQGIPVFLDPVSAPKAERSKKHIGRFHTIKPNRGEAEVLCGFSIEDEQGLSEAGKWFVDQGVRRVYITLGEDGVYYKDDVEEGVIAPGNVRVVSATGAGDAFSAAIMKGFISNKSIKETACYGMAASKVTMGCKTAVNPDICESVIALNLK
ncbi:MAG: carbohydrate kinase family protein [Aminipila sp.]